MARSARDILEIITAILLGLVSVATAFGAYQAANLLGAAAEHHSVSQQLRDRNLNEVVGAELQLRDDSAKLFEALALSGEAVAFPDRIAEVFERQDFIVSTTSPEFAAAWQVWADSGFVDATIPLANPDYQVALFADGHAMQYVSAVADGIADHYEAKADGLTIASVLFAIALFLLGVAGVMRSWVVALVLASGATAVFLGGLAVMLVAML